jgi:hypothetical protein
MTGGGQNRKGEMMKIDMRDCLEPLAIVGLAVLGLAVALLSGCKTLDTLIDRFDSPDVPTVADPVPDVPRPQPGPAVTVPATSEAETFTWEPRGDHIYIRIPASIGVTKFTLSCLSPHVYIYGPMPSRANEYNIPGSALDWVATATKANPKGHPSIMVYVNTDSMQATGHASAGWRIMDPQQTYRGDAGLRLQKGENR